MEKDYFKIRGNDYFVYRKKEVILYERIFVYFFYDETSDENFIRLTSLITLQITLTPNRS